MAGGKISLLSMIFVLNLILNETVQAQGPLGIITDLLQNNVAGEPLVHKRTNWDFDPDVSEKRRELFYEANGFRGAKFIERIGVGIDGNEEERRLEQATRDEGRLNGEHYKNFP